MTNVTQSMCTKRMGLVATSAAVLVILVSWAIVAGRMAQSDAVDVKTEFATHAAAQAEREQHAKEKLDDIQTTVKEIDTKLDKALRERHVGGG